MVSIPSSVSTWSTTFSSSSSSDADSMTSSMVSPIISCVMSMRSVSMANLRMMCWSSSTTNDENTRVQLQHCRTQQQHDTASAYLHLREVHLLVHPDHCLRADTLGQRHATNALYAQNRTLVAPFIAVVIAWVDFIV